LLELLLSRLIYLLFILNKEKKRLCLSVPHYYFISEKTPKHSHAFIQTSLVFAAFWPLCRYKLIARSILTAERLIPTLRVKLVFYFEHILRLKTTAKSMKTFQTERSKCVAGSYPTPPLLILLKRNH
jgi:hypothetical protein